VNLYYHQVINNLEIVEERQVVVRFHIAKDPFVGMLNKKYTSHLIYIVILLISN